MRAASPISKALYSIPFRYFTDHIAPRVQRILGQLGTSSSYFSNKKELFAAFQTGETFPGTNQVTLGFSWRVGNVVLEVDDAPFTIRLEFGFAFAGILISNEPQQTGLSSPWEPVYFPSDSATWQPVKGQSGRSRHIIEKLRGYRA